MIVLGIRLLFLKALRSLMRRKSLVRFFSCLWAVAAAADAAASLAGWLLVLVVPLLAVALVMNIANLLFNKRGSGYVRQ